MASNTTSLSDFSQLNWIVFDFGGTIVTSLDRTNPIPEDFTGAILLDYLRKEIVEISPDLTAQQLEDAGIAANAHLRDKGFIMNQRSRETNLRYLGMWVDDIVRSFGLELDPVICLKAAMHYVEESGRLKMQMHDSAALRETFTRLQERYRLGVLSNNSGFVEHQIKCLGIDDLFEFILDSANTGFIKPESEIFIEMLSHTGACPADKVMYVGDNYLLDIVGAKSMGMAAAWVNAKGKDIPEGERLHPDLTVKHISELPELLISSEAMCTAS